MTRRELIPVLGLGALGVAGAQQKRRTRIGSVSWNFHSLAPGAHPWGSRTRSLRRQQASQHFPVGQRQEAFGDRHHLGIAAHEHPRLPTLNALDDDFTRGLR